jgi:hypothetical protein
VRRRAAVVLSAGGTGRSWVVWGTYLEDWEAVEVAGDCDTLGVKFVSH